MGVKLGFLLGKMVLENGVLRKIFGPKREREREREIVAAE
jgi:hypothetical protein